MAQVDRAEGLHRRRSRPIAGALERRPSRRSSRRRGKPLGIKINIIKKDANAANADADTRPSTPGMTSRTGRWTSPTPTSWCRSPSTRRRARTPSTRTTTTPQVIKRTPGRRQREFDPAKRQALYSKIQKHGRRGRVHGVPLLLAVPLRVRPTRCRASRSIRPATTTWRTSGCRSSRRRSESRNVVDRLAYVLRRLAAGRAGRVRRDG